MTVFQLAVIKAAERMRGIPEEKRPKKWHRLIAAAEDIQRRIAAGKTARKTPIPKTSYEKAAERKEPLEAPRHRSNEMLDIEAEEWLNKHT